MTMAGAYRGRRRKDEAVAYAVGEDRSDFQPGGGSWSECAFGFTKFTEGTGWRAKTAPGNWLRLRQQGKRRGGYHFFHPGENPVAQAEFFIRYVEACGGWEPGDMFAGDFEIAIGAGGTEVIEEHRRPRMNAELLRLPDGLRAGMLGTGARAFLDEVARLAGPACPVLAYTYLSFLPNLAECLAYPLWIADYSAHPPASVQPWPHWDIWQNADRGGQGGGDADLFHGTEKDLAAWIGSYAGGWTEALVADLPTLRLGDKDAPGQNQAVGKMQALISFVGTKNGLPDAAGLAEDGAFGPATRQAVQAVQAFYHITGGNGECGQRTWEHLIGG